MYAHVHDNNITHNSQKAEITDCPSTTEQMGKMCSTHTMEYYSTLKTNETPIHTTAWMNLENVMPSEVSQKKSTNTV